MNPKSRYDFLIGKGLQFLRVILEICKNLPPLTFSHITHCHHDKGAQNDGIQGNPSIFFSADLIGICHIPINSLQNRLFIQKNSQKRRYTEKKSTQFPPRYPYLSSHSSPSKHHRSNVTNGSKDHRLRRRNGLKVIYKKNPLPWCW
jgi:hypothetical protein